MHTEYLFIFLLVGATRRLAHGGIAVEGPAWAWSATSSSA